MSSGLDDWICWHFFTIKVTYNSSYIELLLNDVCLTNLRLLSESLKFTNELPYISARESNRDHRLQEFHYCSSWMRCLGNMHGPLNRKIGNSVSSSTIPAFMRCLPKRCSAMDCSSFLSRKRVLTSRCLVMDYSVTILLNNLSVVWQSATRRQDSIEALYGICLR
jgi:hypothetical protein